MGLFDLEGFIRRLESAPIDHSMACRDDLPNHGEMSNVTGYLLEEHVRTLFRKHTGVALLEPPYPCFDGEYLPGFKAPRPPKAYPCRQPESWSSQIKDGRVLRHLRSIDGRVTSQVVDVTSGHPLAEFDVLADLPDRYVIGETKFMFNVLEMSLLSAAEPIRLSEKKKRSLAPFLPDRKPIEYWFMGNSELIYEFARLEAENNRFAMSLSNFQRRGNRLLRLNAGFGDYRTMVDIISRRYPVLIQTIPFPDVRMDMSRKYLQDI